jgi:hypothetical protein
VPGDEGLDKVMSGLGLRQSFELNLKVVIQAFGKKMLDVV